MSERKSDPDRDDSERAFFGRRKGHKLRQDQTELIDHLLPHLALDIASEAPATAGEIFDSAANDLRLEIGFGGGEHLAAEAQAFSTTGFIGCEVLAAAEPDLEPYLARRGVEDLACIGRRLSADVQRKMRQQLLDQPRLVLPELVTLAPPEEGALAVVALGI